MSFRLPRKNPLPFQHLLAVLCNTLCIEMHTNLCYSYHEQYGIYETVKTNFPLQVSCDTSVSDTGIAIT